MWPASKRRRSRPSAKVDENGVAFDRSGTEADALKARSMLAFKCGWNKPAV
ncbi:hypothetical protein X740_14450 [Mesorhizobium sp. LNHC221B00]|nr:hypothetical protein X740_14450 [Mesorhizobium sp. LNHC221B00]